MNWLDFFANKDFMPHGHCYLWREDILWTHVISDLVIAIAYYAIPIVLGILWHKRKERLPMPELVLLFIAFIFLCGTTHLVSIYVTWYPAYEYQGWLKALTAIVSIITAIVLAPKLPELLSLPGIQEAYKESQAMLKKIKSEKAEMESIYQLAMDREARVLALKKEVNVLLAEQRKPKKYLLENDAS